MGEVERKNDDLSLFVIEVIKKYCPYVEDRLELMNSIDAPKITINMRISNDVTNTWFLYGSEQFYHSVDEQRRINQIVDFDEICSIIDFILNDHVIISFASFNNSKLKMIFSINWCDASIRGIKCGDIQLNVESDNTFNLSKYAALIAEKYRFRFLRPEMIEGFDLASQKQQYFNKLDKSGLIGFIDRMDEAEIRALLSQMSNTSFINSTESPVKQGNQIIKN